MTKLGLCQQINSGLISEKCRKLPHNREGKQYDQLRKHLMKLNIHSQFKSPWKTRKDFPYSDRGFYQKSENENFIV